MGKFFKKKSKGFHFNNSYLNLPELFYEKRLPEVVSMPKMLVLNQELIASIGFELSQFNKQETAEIFSGNRILDGSDPFAQAYAGHQFGHFTMLGDGRAHVLGEHIQSDGKRFDIQLKGSGRTRYSRRGDGRASLGPMLREYIISEAMHSLGIPTTRSLAVVSTGEKIIRETELPGAVLTRLASSHIRIGTFEFAIALGDNEMVKALLNYTVNRHDQEINNDPNMVTLFLKKVMKRQIDLVIHWMRVGFIHGVMNTDNMAISGETIDYGPCAFMDAYNPGTVFSSIDQMGRYAFANQPVIAEWNFARLVETVFPLIGGNQQHAIEIAKSIIAEFPIRYKHKYIEMMSSKIGLIGQYPEDEALINQLLDWMKNNNADYTNTFRNLSQKEKPSGSYYETDEFHQWYENWQMRLKKNNASTQTTLKLMQKVNPAIIPRNHQVEAALTAAIEGNMNLFNNLLTALKDPYKDGASITAYQSPPTPSERVYQTFCGT